LAALANGVQNCTLQSQVGQAQAQVSQTVGTNNGAANTGALGHDTNLYIAESV